MKIITNNPISFGYKSILKTYWLEGQLPTVQKGIYGGTLKPYNVTLEHIRPHSKGGTTALNNLALAKDVLNYGRGNRPFRMFFSRKVFDEYCDQFVNVKLPGLDGNKYIKALRETVEKALKNGY